MTPTTDDLLEQSQWDWFWVPSFARVVDRPELCFASVGFDRPSINRVTRTRAPDDRLDALVAEVSAAHRAVRSCWMVTAPTAALEGALTRGGYASRREYRAYAIEVPAYRPRPERGHRVVQVADRDGMVAALEVENLGFGDGRSASDVEVELALRSATRPDGRSPRFLVYDADDRPVAAGGLHVYPALRFGFLWAGATVPEARGRGAYSALLGARMAVARALGLERVGIYASVETSAPMVEAQGFAGASPMWIWDRPSGG